MSWLYLALLSAALAAGASIAEKRVLFREHAMEFVASLSVINAALTLPFLAGPGLADLDYLSLGLIVLVSVAAAGAFLLAAKAIRHMEISVSSPLLALGPGATALLAFLILGEALSQTQTGGIILMVCGVYLLESHRTQAGIGYPWREFWRSRYTHYLLGAMLIYGLTSVSDRVVLAHLGIQPTIYLALVHIFEALSFLIMLTLFHDGWRGIKHGLQKQGVWLLVVALLTVGYRLAAVMAMKVAYAGLVSAVKKMSVLFAVIIGGELFHEKNLPRKVAASAIIIGGGILLAL